MNDTTLKMFASFGVDTLKTAIYLNKETSENHLAYHVRKIQQLTVTV